MRPVSTRGQGLADQRPGPGGSGFALHSERQRAAASLVAAAAFVKWEKQSTQNPWVTEGHPRGHAGGLAPSKRTRGRWSWTSHVQGIAACPFLSPLHPQHCRLPALCHRRQSQSRGKRDLGDLRVQ